MTNNYFLVTRRAKGTNKIVHEGMFFFDDTSMSETLVAFRSAREMQELVDGHIKLYHRTPIWNAEIASVPVAWGDS